MEKLFNALAAQSLEKDKFEILVCDDGSSAGEAEAIESLVMKARGEHKLTVACLRQPRTSAGSARNLGLAHARSDLVAFTDSDCVPAPQWLERLVAGFDDPPVALAGGPAEGRGAATLGGRCVNFLMTTTLGAGGARDPRSALHVKFFPRSYNLAVRRSIALAVGGFPATFYGEDIEFSERVTALGGRVAFIPDAVVVHDERRSPWGTAVQSFTKGVKRFEMAGRCGMHNVLYAAPAFLLAILATWLALFWSGSPLILWAAVPLLIYALAMGGLGVYGSVAMREVAAVAALPCYAILMHATYGLGYWCAVVRALVRWATGMSIDRVVASAPEVALYASEGAREAETPLVLVHVQPVKEE